MSQESVILALNRKMLELMDTQQKHQSFIDREASIIEQEVSAVVNAHLKNRFKRLKLVIPNAFMKVLRDPRDHQTKLTDLDGVFFLTKTPAMYDADEVINVPMSDRVRELLQEVETERRKMKKVYMFIGGAMWDDRAYAKINAVLKEDNDLKEYIGVVKASGARYTVLDTSTSWR